MSCRICRAKPGKTRCMFCGAPPEKKKRKFELSFLELSFLEKETIEEEWLLECYNQLKKFNMETSGCETLDRRVKEKFGDWRDR